ncbi:MAG: hypothetical protein IKI57_02075 [Clostridia bacterium]|nr:hypothetical protein [Clostridia bacterium]
MVCGNAINSVRDISFINYSVENVHNIYFQMLLDVGVFGFIYYVYLIFLFIVKNIKYYFSNPYIAFNITYLIIGLIQFRGGDIVLFIVLALFLAEKYHKNYCNS